MLGKVLGVMVLLVASLVAQATDYSLGGRSSVLLTFTDLQRQCTGTAAIAPNLILTAQHCIEVETEIIPGLLVRTDVIGVGHILVNNMLARYRVVAADGADHVILLVSHLPELRVAQLATTQPIPGRDEVYLIGNPGQFRHLLRTGHRTGRFGDRECYSFPTYQGDSGSAYFNAAGEIVGVNWGYFTTPMRPPACGSLGLPLQFTHEQLQHATMFSVLYQEHLHGQRPPDP